MKKLVPIPNEEVAAYWRRCQGKFGGNWYIKAVKQAQKFGFIVDLLEKHQCLKNFRHKAEFAAYL